MIIKCSFAMELSHIWIFYQGSKHIIYLLKIGDDQKVLVIEVKKIVMWFVFKSFLWNDNVIFNHCSIVMQTWICIKNSDSIKLTGSGKLWEVYSAFNKEHVGLIYFQRVSHSNVLPPSKTFLFIITDNMIFFSLNVFFLLF